MKIDKSCALLLISSLGLTPIAFSYGVNPELSLNYLFGLEINNVNGNHIFRAVMCLYLFNLSFWLLGVFKKSYRQIALITLSIFMLGLAVGRLLSFFLDGQPHWLLILYFILEFSIGISALYLIKQNQDRAQ
ncbi:DUF4345 domain-containing protein [Vibrio parahaemolyticus]|uniref:DUF4345 domain-containing protein n=1 Tax=Vibrio TaxID=662 RepID=UPI001E01138F|nr:MULTISPECIES: DUF4345 domain-containing protein [Vibrio]EGQ8062076.1 DUF4345 domain-containing protein [Vibrio parahaemolyticus]EGR2205791.1 DUF4345 domain-containing protein [Vibrio parahaemolyticus]EHH1037726.1 DUF4345 domain-containing protein [Vibrio parahaemolyticus]EHH1251651.1 DUF4345 domain-containing protein [Vibrio parahaemolyticus]EHH3642032.1 DUF4345 domain-containing protein [Vibrio parahaemolyticus]